MTTMSTWDQLVKYAHAAASVLHVPGRVVLEPEDKTVYIGGAWCQLQDDGSFIIGTTVHDPGVRYHRDGSGTPPSDDPVEITDDEMGVEQGLVHGTPRHAIYLLVRWHQDQQIKEALADVGMDIQMAEVPEPDPEL